MRVAAVPFAVLLLLGACSSPPDDDGTLRVVTTVSPITSIAASVIGDRAEISGVVPEGTNSHTFDPAPSVAATLSRADVVFVNGLELETPTIALAETNLADGARIVELADETIDEDDYVYDFSFPRSGGHPNPHLWTNPPYALRFAELIAGTMTELDPDGAADYEANLERFSASVDELDEALREAVGTVPAERRKLLTYHDSFPYFAREYGFEVIGAIQPSDFSEPSPKDVADLIEQIRDEEVPAIFGSEVFPSPVLQTISRESGAEYVDELRDDDLPGEPGDDEHSWLGLMVFDYVTIVDALGGDPSALEAIDTSPVSEDRASYT